MFNNNFRKKIISFALATAISVSSLCNFVFAQNIDLSTPTIKCQSVKYNQDGTITINADIKNQIKNQIISIIISEYDKTNTIGNKSIVYVNTFKPDISQDNSFTFTLTPADWIDWDTYNQYVAVIGGTNIVTSSCIVFSKDNNNLSVYYGDIDGDGDIDINDAQLVLLYVRNPDDNPLTPDQKRRAKVSGTNIITATDSAYILEKSINPDFNLTK